MPRSSPLHTIRLPLRKICSALPAVALISGAIMVPASAAQGIAATVGATSDSSPAIVVPDVAMTMPGSAQIEADPFPMPPRKERAPKVDPPALQPLESMLPAGTLPGSSTPVTLDSAGIPVRALDAYRTAADLVSSADPGCHIDWALLGAIGRVESNHARFGGNQLDASGVARPGIFGIPLDGSNGTARILDTDHGLLDRDTVYDRAVGPMQFIPSTWRVAGVDANGDGVKDPQNVADAAAATAVYLCSGKGDLRRPDDLRSAILRYNASDSYAAMVSAIADAYRQGVTALPASDLTLVPPAAAVSDATNTATKPANPAPGKPASGKPGVTSPTATSQQPALLPTPSTTIPPTSQPTPLQPSTTEPAPPSTQPPSTTQPVPTSTQLPNMSTCAPTATPTISASPTSPPTCPPAPCAPTSTPNLSSSPTSASAPSTPCSSQTATA